MKKWGFTDFPKKLFESFALLEKESNLKKINACIFIFQIQNCSVQKDYEAERIAREVDLQEKQDQKKNYESQLSVSTNYYQQIENNLQLKKRQRGDLQ